MRLRQTSRGPQLVLTTVAVLFCLPVIVLSFNPLSDVTSPFIRLVDTFYDELSEGAKSECQEHAELLLEANSQAQDWATRVVDASGHPDSGLLNGGFTYPGLYTECIDVNVNLSASNYKSFTFNGQQCIGEFTLYGKIDEPPSNISSSLWNPIVNNSLRIGLCFPLSCSSEQASFALNSTLKKTFQGVDYDVQIHSCNSKSSRPPAQAGVYIVLVVLFLLISISVIGTSYDIMKTLNNNYDCLSAWRKSIASSDNEVNHPSTLELCDIDRNNHETMLSKVLMAFSLVKNGAKILHVGKQEGSIDIFHGIRFLSMLWIIMGHSCSFALSWLVFKNPQKLGESGSSNILSQTLENGTFSVDTFFYLSGFLLIYVAMKSTKKVSSAYHILSAILHRYIRMTPLMMIIIAFTSNLLQYLGSGPFWSSSIMMYDSWCRSNWWTNLLYLQNFVNTNTMCLSHSWYSAVDFQFFIIGIVVLYIIHKNNIVGLTSIGVLLLITVTVTAYLIAANNYPPVPYIGNIVSQDLANAFSSNVYIKPYCRMGPYLIGMALGYVLYCSKGDITVPKKYVFLGWFLSVVVNITILYSTWPAYLGHLPSRAEATIYGAIARTVWACGISWLTFACVSGYGGFVTTILSWRVFVPLSRLTYCAYLIHPVVMAVFYGSREISYDFSQFMLLYFILGNLVITYVLAFFLSALFESPFISLEKIFFKI